MKSINNYLEFICLQKNMEDNMVTDEELSVEGFTDISSETGELPRRTRELPRRTREVPRRSRC